MVESAKTMEPPKKYLKESEVEVKEEDKKFDTYPAEVQERYDRERQDEINRNKEADKENKRRNGLLEEVEKKPEEKKETKEEKEKKDKKEKLLKQVGDILKENNNNESEVPPNSPYWQLLSELRSL